MDLAASLRLATHSRHRAVEGLDFVRALLGGALDRQSYCLMLRSLLDIYTALESALDRQPHHPALAAAKEPALRRGDALRNDLDRLHGANWREALPAQASALRYADHLRCLATAHPPLLLAHAYVRYLGDLSGGQAIRRVIVRSLNLHDGEGTAFYDFGDSAAVARLAQGFRAGLAAVRDDVASHASIVSEAVEAFDRHDRMFRELERSRQARRIPG
jgi:heme oxygenase (biliverdin-producing, ferredoxin)